MKSLSISTTSNAVSSKPIRRALYICGILSSLLYVAMNIITAKLYIGYNTAAQTVSELSAIGAPTRPLWVLLMMVYSPLALAFGWGVWKYAAGNRPLRVAGLLLMIYVIIGIFWPPMHQREVLAAGGGSMTDTLH